MNREIKFRGKIANELVDDWVYGFYAQDMELDEEENLTSVHSIISEAYEDAGIWFDIDPQTLGQYTGLKDKNGQPIYEGDILQINIMDWNRPGNVIASGKAAVEYRGCTFGVEWGFSRDFSGLDSFSRNCTFEVIGNVMDSPELLEDADD